MEQSIDTSSSVRRSVETSGSFGSDPKLTQQSGHTSNNEIVSAVVVALKELLHGLGPNGIKVQETGIHDTRSGHIFDGGSHVFDGGALGSGLLQNVDVSVEIMRVDQPVHDPPDMRKPMKETGRHNKPHRQKHLDFAIPYSWRQEALSHLDAKISEKRKKATKQRPRNIPLESRDVVLYSRDGVEVPKLRTNLRRRYKEKQSHPLDQLIPRRKDADQSAAERLGSRFTRENVKTNMLQLPMGQIYDKRSDISQELTRVGLRPQTKGRVSILRSAYSEMEPVRRTRVSKLSRSSQRRTREHAQSRRELRTDLPARSRSYKRDSRVISFGTSETWTPWLNQKLTPRLYQKLSQRLFQKLAPSRRLSQKGTPRLFQTLSHRLSRRRTRRLSYQPGTINPNSIPFLGKTSRRRASVSRTSALAPYRTRKRLFSAGRGPLSRAYARSSRAPLYLKRASKIRTTPRRASFRETSRGQTGNNLVRLRLPAFRYRPY